MGVVSLVVIACVLRATTKKRKGRQLFGGIKVHPAERILSTPMTSPISLIVFICVYSVFFFILYYCNTAGWT